MSDVHICGLVVHVVPQSLDTIAAAILEIPGCEVAARAEQGKIVVTTEAESEHASAEIIDRLQGLPGVINVVMAYHQCEDASVMQEEISYVSDTP